MPEKRKADEFSHTAQAVLPSMDSSSVQRQNGPSPLDRPQTDSPSPGGFNEQWDAQTFSNRPLPFNPILFEHGLFEPLGSETGAEVEDEVGEGHNTTVTKDQLFTLDGIDVPPLYAPTAPKCPYTFALSICSMAHACVSELQDKSLQLEGWEDGKYRWERKGSNVPKHMPHFTIYRQHPCVPDPKGVAYVYEGCPETLLNNCRQFPSLEIPMSVDKDVLENGGLLELEPRMYILYRDVRKSRDPKDDLLK
ncbi:hypothetical protein SCHPADRAFT_897139, partial [Schizopora paradoxa]